jgi:hypothetical protein
VHGSAFLVDAGVPNDRFDGTREENDGAVSQPLGDEPKRDRDCYSGKADGSAAHEERCIVARVMAIRHP